MMQISPKNIADLAVKSLDKAPQSKEALSPGQKDPFTQFLSQWENAGERSNQLMDSLPAESKNFLEVQVLVNRLQMQSMLVTKAGETASSTVRKVQQMGQG